MRAADVLEVLDEEGLIRNELIAGLLVRFRGWSTIQVGTYRVHAGMSLEEMFELFEEGSFVAVPMTYIIIPEGFTIRFIAERFAAQSEIEVDAQYLLELWSDTAFLNELINEFWFITDEILNPDLYHPLEGYFYPIRHEIPVGLTDPREMTRVMLQMTERRLRDTGLQAEIQASEHTFHEILALAAIVEAETQEVVDMSAVAGVYWNRINRPYYAGTQGLLNADPTVVYAYIEAGGEHRTVVTNDMTQGTISPFNTYLNAGSPPGPVNSPSEHAIRAVINPSEHNYFFFMSDMYGCHVEEGSDAEYSDPGRKIFAVFLWEHDLNVERYLNPSNYAGRSLCNPHVQIAN